MMVAHGTTRAAYCSSFEVKQQIVVYAGLIGTLVTRLLSITHARTHGNPVLAQKESGSLCSTWHFARCPASLARLIAGAQRGTEGHRAVPRSGCTVYPAAASGPKTGRTTGLLKE